MGNKNMDEPCKGDTPAQPRAQALGKSMNHIYEPQRGGTTLSKTNARAESAAPTELDITFGSCIPRVSFRALPSFHPGLCRSIVPTALIR